MIDLIATAKCGLLDNMFRAIFWVPMMPTVIAMTAFAVAEGMGRALGHVLGLRPVRVGNVWPMTRLVLAAIAALSIVAIAIHGVAYPLFLARMVKDACYCSYFEAGRDLQAVHWIVFCLMFLAQTSCVAIFDDRWLRALHSRCFQTALIVVYVALGIVGYVMAIVLDATLVPLTVLFILPFAYCGIGLLARRR
jgi:hypothetical protein